MERLGFIDSIKGLAIILVVIGHVANGYLGQGVTNVHHTVYNIIYAFHMPLFFTISGFLFYHAYFTKAGTIKRIKVKEQIINLICIYFVFSLLLCSTKMIFSGYVNNKTSLNNLLMLPIRPLDLYWYLYVLIIECFIFSREVLIHKKKSITLLFTLALAILSYWITGRYGRLFCMNRVLYYMFFFYTGILLSTNLDILKKRGLLFGLLPIILLLFVLFTGQEKYINRIQFANIIMGLSCSLCIFGAFYQYKILGEDNRILSFIGTYCLEIYLLHTYFVTFCRSFLRLVKISNPLLIYLISIFMGIIIPIVIANICKKMGIYNYIFSPYKKAP